MSDIVWFLRLSVILLDEGESEESLKSFSSSRNEYILIRHVKLQNKKSLTIYKNYDGVMIEHFICFQREKIFTEFAMVNVTLEYLLFILYIHNACDSMTSY